mmetsp:Transcript_3448/g.5893  ORF Transcript_3448/g.5893 Transcript_3448/m.5893 type:complete len:94 (+) Transcript_3448:12-293(+)
MYCISPLPHGTSREYLLPSQVGSLTLELFGAQLEIQLSVGERGGGGGEENFIHKPLGHRINLNGKASSCTEQRTFPWGSKAANLALKHFSTLA